MKNNLLHLNKTFVARDKEPSGFAIAFYKSLPVSLKHLNDLLYSLYSTAKYWNEQTLLDDVCLISAYCYGVVAKSNRISQLFKFRLSAVNDLVVGARFGGAGENHFHIFTYCFSKQNLMHAIKKLENVILSFENYFGDQVTKEQMTFFKEDRSIDLKNEYFTKAQFISLIQELSYINRFDTYFCEENIDDNAIVTLFDTNKSILHLLQEININISNERINAHNVLLLPDEFIKLKAAAPYLISMAVSDFSLVDLPEPLIAVATDKKIDDPKSEPIIGVIDTLFDTKVYFSKWVKYVEVLDTTKIPTSSEDYAHGTAVTSLIVDLPNINPDLNDGCGNFRVRHFGVALKNGGMTTFKLMKEIEAIVSANQDIHVWNLSLGSARPVNENFISPEASILDDLQVKFPNIIFIIAGTNNEEGKATSRIGAPADSINSLVVNSVRRSDSKPASYSRSGPALSFFIKPDVSYYGGDFDEPINVCYPNKVVESWGTSLAAPLIARKIAYMIDVLKIPRACAKALLIDSAIGWKRPFDLEDSNLIGRGIVPIDINDIVKSNGEEIKFFIEGDSIKYRTYEYDLPVPLNKDNRFPYAARATLCYFPHCSRNQGVDYTDTEISLKFGRTRNNEKQTVESINKDYQDMNGYFTKEKDARGLFRKWDNVKVLTDVNPKIPKLNFGRNNWGIEVTYSRRYEVSGGVKRPQRVKWGIAITLKALDGKNRFDEFVHACIINGWRVYAISVDNMVKVYNQSQIDIQFDDKKN